MACVCRNKGRNCAKRLFIGVYGIGDAPPVQHVADGFGGLLWISLRQQEGGLMLCARKIPQAPNVFDKDKLA